MVQGKLTGKIRDDRIKVAAVPQRRRKERRIQMKLGIIGAGKIAQEFLPMLKQMEGLEITGIMSTPRGLERTRELAGRYGIPHAVADFQELCHTGMDTVYVAVPNHLHYQYGKEALERGLHVILEKPITTNIRQAEELDALAREKNLFLFEAITTPHLKNYQKIREWLPRIGEIKLVQSQFTQYSPRYDDFRAGKVVPVFDPAQAGGVLMDLGLYTLHFIMDLFGEPNAALYHPNMERGSDTSGIICLDYGSFQGFCVAAKDSQGITGGMIQGTEGFIQSHDLPNMVGKVTLTLRDGTREEYDDGMWSARAIPEFTGFMKAIEEKDYAFREKCLEESLAVCRVMTRIRLAAGIRYPGDQ